MLFLGAVALALRRGEAWARWATVALAGLVSFGGLFGTLLKVGDPGDAFLLPLVTMVFGPVPIPFVFRWGASDHFGSAAPSDPLPPLPAQPAVDPTPAPAPPSLTDRWFT